MNEELKFTAMVAAAVVVIALAVIGAISYSENVMPLKMAEKGLCWDPGLRSYQPCREAK